MERFNGPSALNRLANAPVHVGMEELSPPTRPSRETHPNRQSAVHGAQIARGGVGGHGETRRCR